MEIESFKELFYSLTQLSPLDFEIWSEDGFVFSSRTDVSGMSTSKQLENVSTHIMSEGCFYHSSDCGKKTIFGVPIRDDGQIVGCLLAYGKDFKKCESNEIVPTTASDIYEIKKLLTQLVLIIEDRWNMENERNKITEELGSSFEDLYLYSQVTDKIKTLTFSSQFHNELVLDILKTMRVDISFVKILDKEENKIAFCDNDMSVETDNVMNKFVEKLLNAISIDNNIQTGKYFVLEDSRTNRQFSKLLDVQYRFLAVKIAYEGKNLGWIGLVSFNLKEVFRRSELRLLTSMAEQLAMVIVNTNLYADLENFMINLVKSMISAVEAKDVYTRGHSERVSRMCLYMAEYLGLIEVDKKNLEWAAILHDVGKIGVPESILCKEGPLDGDEYEIIKQHPLKGREILEHIEQFRDVLPGVLHHHESYDGSGYPNGLKGEGIPLYARIISIVDTFDSITTNRPYRQRNGDQKALSVIEELAGTQFDPYLVHKFKEVYAKKIVLDKVEQSTTTEMSTWQCQQL